MATVNVTYPSDGTTADAGDIKNAVQPLLTEFNGNIDNTNIKSGAAIATSKLAEDAGIKKTMVGTDSSWAWQSWTPTWTNLTIGNATVVAKYIQVGKTVICRLSMVMGSTTSISGHITFSLPVTAVSYPLVGSVLDTLGSALITDSGTATIPADIRIASTTTAVLTAFNASGTYVNGANATASVPMTWTTNDAFTSTFIYEAA